MQKYVALILDINLPDGTGFQLVEELQKANVIVPTIFLTANTNEGIKVKGLNMGGMQAKIDPRAEWKQMYAETWRIQREFFYDPGFHGLNLKKIEAKYAPYLDGLSSRSDLTYLQNEMLGEITDPF